MVCSHCTELGTGSSSDLALHSRQHRRCVEGQVCRGAFSQSNSRGLCGCAGWGKPGGRRQQEGDTDRTPQGSGHCDIHATFVPFLCPERGPGCVTVGPLSAVS